MELVPPTGFVPGLPNTSCPKVPVFYLHSFDQATIASFLIPTT